MIFPKALAAAILSLAILSGCAAIQNAGVSVCDWWKRPTTQEVVIRAQQIALNFAISAGLAALQQYATGQPFDYRTVAIAGGAATLWQQASNIRQLQGTSQVLDPIATAKLLEKGGTNKEISEKLAAQLFDNASKLIEVGMTPDKAAEVNAAGLDAAAVILRTSEIK